MKIGAQMEQETGRMLFSDMPLELLCDGALSLRSSRRGFVIMAGEALIALTICFDDRRHRNVPPDLTRDPSERPGPRLPAPRQCHADESPD
jgi:hypothetical protein